MTHQRDLQVMPNEATQIIPARPGEAALLYEASDPISIEVRNILTADEFAALDRGETVTLAHQRFFDYRARQSVTA